MAVAPTPQHRADTTVDAAGVPNLKQPARPAAVVEIASQPPRGLPMPSTGSWLAWSGWILSMLLAVYLIRAQSRWRAAFENKEWLLLPSTSAANMTAQLQSLAHQTTALQDGVLGSTHVHTKSTDALTKAIQDTRAEFAILRDELDRKTKEIAELKLGHEFHSRRPVLRAIAHALQIIEEDAHGGTNPESTLAGVASELRECLQDNNVSDRTYEPGTRLSDAKGVSTHESIKEPAPEDGLRGTIGETRRSAYMVIGPTGAEEILRHARVKIYT
jgi:molecular chaperone GrpE (heat shock protein)